jgi:hypothetical protein
LESDGGNAQSVLTFSLSPQALVLKSTSIYMVVGAPGAQEIRRYSRFSPSDPFVTIADKISTVRGLAVNDAYVFWTTQDGLVLRAPR